MELEPTSPVTGVSRLSRATEEEEIHQSWIEQVPIGRLIDPLETASAIVFLSMPASGGIRGVSLAVDGGRLRSI